MPLNRTPLRWVGGKQRLSELIVSRIEHSDLKPSRYFEPFLGGGSVFFRLRPSLSTIGDMNPDLILFYRFLRDTPAALKTEAIAIDHSGSKENYDSAREEFNAGAEGLRRAALFLFLNRTGFNGIWRVNRRGQYTVPFGNRRLSLIADVDWLAASKALAAADLRCEDYVHLLDDARASDVVFIDPPYFDSSGTELFSRYTLHGFSIRDHERLRQQVQLLNDREVRFLMTVRDDPKIRDLYADFKIDTVAVRTTVRARGAHVTVEDLLITNLN